MADVQLWPLITGEIRRVLINSNHSYSAFSCALGSSGASWGGICRGALAGHIMESDWFKKSCGISDPKSPPSGKVRHACGWSSHLYLTLFNYKCHPEINPSTGKSSFSNDFPMEQSAGSSKAMIHCHVWVGLWWNDGNQWESYIWIIPVAGRAFRVSAFINGPEWMVLNGFDPSAVRACLFSDIFLNDAPQWTCKWCHVAGICCCKLWWSQIDPSDMRF